MFGIKFKIRAPKVKISKPTVSLKRHKSLKGRTEGIEDILALTSNDNLADLGIKALKIADKKFNKAISDEEKANKQIESGEVSADVARVEQDLRKKQVDAIKNVVKAK